jgi:uncharacterized damage-inducible protein DinB
MALADALLPEFDHEMANTRRTLERVPEDRFDWKPHEKSWAMGGLATHVANLAGWPVYIVGRDELDIAPPGEKPFTVPPATSTSSLLETFDANVAASREAIAGASDEHMLAPWSLIKGGKTIVTMPRAGFLRSFVMNHLIHHRAQLGVYLRLNDLPVPSIYGPSADEGSL